MEDEKNILDGILNKEALYNLIDRENMEKAYHIALRIIDEGLNLIVSIGGAEIISKGRFDVLWEFCNELTSIVDEMIIDKRNILAKVANKQRSLQITVN